MQPVDSPRIGPVVSLAVSYVESCYYCMHIRYEEIGGTQAVWDRQIRERSNHGAFITRHKHHARTAYGKPSSLDSATDAHRRATP